MIYPAANRDPRVFEHPRRFDIRRSFEKPALAFGWGKHYCLGASLARLEMKVVLEGLLSRLPDIRLDPERKPVERPSSFLRGLASLPVRFKAV
jgi:cytochrome P450 family 142 subfamily A polypeptide 1